MAGFLLLSGARDRVTGIGFEDHDYGLTRGDLGQIAHTDVVGLELQAAGVEQGIVTLR